MVKLHSRLQLLELRNRDHSDHLGTLPFVGRLFPYWVQWRKDGDTSKQRLHLVPKLTVIPKANLNQVEGMIGDYGPDLGLEELRQQ